jgi:hypothetical protein
MIAGFAVTAIGTALLAFLIPLVYLVPEHRGTW